MLWEEITRNARDTGTRRRNVYQEQVQKAVLTALSMRGCFDSIVFQGGTALRLFYGNPRFSEDIDLVLNEGVEGYDLSAPMAHAGRFCHDIFPFLESVEVTAQKAPPEIQRYVLRGRSDDPEQNLRFHVELTSVPSYQNGPRILDFPPIHPAIRVEDTSEILADKVCALAFSPYLKGRDLWDIHYLLRERSVEPRWELVRRKIGDYGKRVSDLDEGLKRTRERIREAGTQVLEGELERFLPRHVLDHYRSVYDVILESILELMREVDEAREVWGRDDR